MANICAIIDARLDALHQEGAEIPVKRKDPVVLPQAEAAADDDRFLADPRVDAAAHFSLTHAQAEALVERADELEPVEHLQQLVGVEFEFRPLDRRRIAETSN